MNYKKVNAALDDYFGKHDILFVIKEIVVGVAQIVWAVVFDWLILSVIVLPIACGVMWTLTRLGFWQMPRWPDIPNGHFKMPKYLRRKEKVAGGEVRKSDVMEIVKTIMLK